MSCTYEVIILHAFYVCHSVAVEQQRHQFMHNDLSVKYVILYEIRLANESDFSL